MGSEQFSLCWDNFHRNMSSGMHSMLETEDLVDVTLAIEGQYLKAHKMVLSVCSPYFRKLFSMNPCKHPIVFMKDVSYIVMNDLLTFMYQGEVQVNQENLASFIKTAEALQIRGLTSDTNEVEDVPEDTKAPKRPATEDHRPPNKSVKKMQPSPAIKKPKLSAPPMNNNSPPPATTTTTTTTMNFTHQRNSMKPEVEAIPVTKPEMVQFKMEPYESTEQNETYETDVQDSYIEDDSQLEEDYSAMENDEPQAGTSGDGLPDSQGRLLRRWKKFGKRKSDTERLNGENHSIRRHPQGKQKDCSFCSNRKIKGARRMTPFFCETCGHMPGLHPEECFERYHTDRFLK